MTTEQKLREALRRIKHEAASLADAQVIALEALSLPTQAEPAAGGATVPVWLAQELDGHTRVVLESAHLAALATPPASQEQAVVEWTKCEFIGAPPAGFDNWNAWACSRKYSMVRVQALHTACQETTQAQAEPAAQGAVGNLLREALQAWQVSSYGTPAHHKAMLLAMTKIGSALSEQSISVTSSMADRIWGNDALMAINAELGLTMDQLLKVAQALSTPQPAPASAGNHIPDAGKMVGAELPPVVRMIHEGEDWVRWSDYCVMMGLRDSSLSAPASAELPEPVAHMYPSTLEKFETEETTGVAFSVAVGCPDERSVPVFTLSQLVDYAEARAALSAQAVPDERDKVDAERYRLLRTGRRWSVLDGLGDVLCSEQLDVAIDAVNAAIAARAAAKD